MPEPGDPKGPAGSEADDHDAHVGFVSPASLDGRARAPEPEPLPEREPDLFDPPEPGPFQLSGATTPTAPFEMTRPRPAPHAAVRETLAREDTAQDAPMSLYAVYVLILLAVPTLGLSALVALFAVTGRAGPSEPLAASHFVYQQRTLWGAAVAAVLGAILVVVNVGVVILFVLAIWVLARGAFGVLKLKSAQAVPRPRSWLF